MSTTAPSEQGKSASTIKTDLSAIRFFHDKMSHPRYTLPGNEELGVALERRRFGQQDRTWTNPEFGKLIGRAMAEERQDYILALYLARYAGLRIHECFRMDTAAAERALRENALTVKGKGGMTPLDAHFTVSRLLGHERPDVTDIYLASVKGGTARGE